MIYEISRAVDARLRSKKFPVHVTYERSELIQAGIQDQRVTMMRDTDQGDSFAAPIGAHQNPRKRADRQVGGRALLWVRSSLPGAMIGDHERLCDTLVDATFCALLEAARVVCRVGSLTVGECKYLSPKELVDLGVAASVTDSWSGVVYSMRFKAPRGVYDVDYAGNGLPETTLNGITGEVRIRRNADDPPEIVELP